MGRVHHLTRSNRVILGTGLALIVMPLFGAIFSLLQDAGNPPVLPPIGQPWFVGMGAIPIGIILVALSIWLNKRAQNKQ